MGSILAAAMDYASRGWKLCAVYPVADGACACERGPACKTPGKHPRGSGWQRSPRPPTYWQRSRDNIGIITGRASGFWVLDYDPAAADVAGADLETLLTGYGLTPQVRTGSGGLHWRFRVPVGRTIANGQNGVGALPAGFDVRGEGGMVVAPPSVSGKGPYVELDTGVCDAPDWLYALMGERRDPASRMDVPSRENPPFEIQGTPTRPPGNVRPGAWEYYNSAIESEVRDYSGLDDGRRGEAMASFARSLIEIVNGANAYGVKWSYDDVWPHFEAAALVATANRPDGGYGAHELPGQWHRAIAHVNERGGWRDMGPEPEVFPPFQPAPVSGAGANGLSGSSDFAVPQFVNPGEIPTGTPVGAAPPPAPPAVTWDQQVEKRAREMLQREQAKALVQRWKLGERRTLAEELIFGDGLDAIADPIPLVEGVLFVNSLARLNGRPGMGKSFVAVDLACSVATGTAWHGRAVRPGPVLYLAAEGLSGLKLRIRAWESDRGVKVGRGLALFPRAVQAAGPEWAELVALAASIRPSLVVLDTQARISSGLNENNSEIDALVAACEAMREVTGAAVLLVHHAGKSGDGETGRGINVVEGAMTSEFGVTKAGNVVTVRTTKQKDIDAPGPIKLTLKTVDDSAVFLNEIIFVDAPAIDRTREQAIALYHIIQRHFGGDGGMGGSRAQIDAHLKTDPSMAGLNMASGQNGAKAILAAWRMLIARGLIIKADRAERFRVLELERYGPEGVLTPAVDVDGPVGWQVWCPEAATLAVADIPVPKPGKGSKVDGSDK
jgi:hypothetical protein